MFNFLSQGNKKLIRNFFSLYILKITNIIIPLIVFPYLVRVLGIDNFGKLAVAQSFGLFFLVFIEFGFDLSIVRVLSKKTNNVNKLSEVSSIVMLLKIFLVLLVATVYFPIIIFFPKFSQDIIVYLCVFGFLMGQGFFPTWFFQSVQDMKFIAILNIFSKLISLVLIFILIKDKNDYVWYPFLLMLGYIMILPIAVYIMVKKYNVKFFIPNYKKLLLYFKYSFNFFLSRISLRLYEQSGMILIGLLLPELLVGYYAIADKLRNAVLSIYSPLSQALYPYMVKYKNKNFYKKFFIFLNILNIVAVVIGFLFTDTILQIIFNLSSPEIISLVRIFLVVILFDVCSVFLGYPLLGAFGYTNYVNYSLIVTALIYLFFLGIFYLFNSIDIFIMAYLYLATILFEFTLRGYGSFLYKLWK
ncbi:oligosaccharide flippase family protein [Haemophilus haemoglobinophilus]|nr:oligosaccharide flippase family protein [Canicola haemoglobinophilus]